MKIAVLALSVSQFCAALILVDEWSVYKTKYKKTYTGPEDERRRSLWQENTINIKEHNVLYSQGKTSFYLNENAFTDMSSTEINEKFKGYNPNEEERHTDIETAVSDFVMSPADDLPDSVDWRLNGSVTEVKDQGECGSCWAFSVVGAIEAHQFKVNGTLVLLSESHLLDCSTENGCNGSSRIKALKYIINNGGIATESSYPYRPEEGPCRFSPSMIGAQIKSYRILPKGNEFELQKAVATIGPVSVSIDASHLSFVFYGGGVYDEPKCSTTKLRHGVLVVGYGTLNNSDYWIVKNSWGKAYGQGGYILMARNKVNACGIASYAVVPGNGQNTCHDKLRHWDIFVIVFILFIL